MTTIYKDVKTGRYGVTSTNIDAIAKAFEERGMYDPETMDYYVWLTGSPQPNTEEGKDV